MTDVARRIHACAEHDHGSAQFRLLLPARLRRWADDAALVDDHWSALGLWFVVGSPLVVAALLLGGPRSSVAAMVVWVGTPSVVGWRWRGRRARRIVAALPASIDLIGRSLRSGASFRHALEECARETPPALAAEFQSIVASLERGAGVAEALALWARNQATSEVRVVAAALAVVAEAESGTTRALEGVSESLRGRAALRAELVALTSQTSASMLVLVVLPLGFLALTALSGQGAFTYLTSDPFGRLCLASGIGLDVLGWMWMRRLISTRVSGP